MQSANSDTERLGEDFARKKRKYFERLALRYRPAIRMHQIGGLRDREPGKEGTRRKKNWANVSQHCLVEAARASILACWLGFPDEWREKLVLACALHDFGKRRDIEETRRLQETGVSGMGQLVQMEEKHFEDLINRGFDPEVVEISGFGGGLPEQLLETRRLLAKAYPNWGDLARLVLHWIDDYTRGNQWVELADIGKKDREGRPFNDLCRRMEQNRCNSLYTPINSEVGRHIPGLLQETKATTTYDVQETLGHWIEEKLSRLIRNESQLSIAPFALAERIDEEIASEIRRAAI